MTKTPGIPREVDALLNDDELALSRARGALALGDAEGNGEQMLASLVNSNDRNVAVRAIIQCAALATSRENHARARSWLEGVQLRSEADIRQLSLELARAWSRIDARSAERIYRDYTARLPITSLEVRSDPSTLNAVALGYYRLGHLVLDTNPDEALALWRSVVESHEVQVAPFAARALATLIGEPRLLPQRVEELYRFAVHSGRPALCSRAAIEVADHLARRLQFREAISYLVIAKHSGDPSQLPAIDARLASLRREEMIAPAMRRLRQPARHIHRIRRMRHLTGTGERVIIVGAGTGGQYFLEALLTSPEPPAVCGFVDDYTAEIPGHPEYWVLGRLTDLPAILRRERPDKVLIAVPTLPGVSRRMVVNDCWDAGVRVRDLSSLHLLRIGWTRRDMQGLFRQMRPVTLSALVGTRRRAVNFAAINWETKPRPLVIGVGALGTDICRALAHGQAQGLIVLDRNPNALRAVERDVTGKLGFPGELLVSIDGDVSRPGVAETVLSKHRPSIVFYAAGSSDPAGCERDPVESVRREVLTALEVAEAVKKQGIDRLVHISHVPGASSFLNALCAITEAAVLSRATAQTTCIVVRSGSLLESPSSIVAMIQHQIDIGGEISIPRAAEGELYLSAINAAELILLAARGAEDMNWIAERSRVYELVGEPLNLSEVAHDLVRLAGLRPALDVPIELTGSPPHPARAPRGLRHPTDDRLIQLESESPVATIDELVGELRDLVSSDDKLGVYRFVGNVRDRIDAARLSPPVAG